MPFYRLYFLHRHSGHIEHVESLPAGDDVEAICQVQQIAHDVPVELWRDGRKVRRFDAKPTPIKDMKASARPPERQAALAKPG